MQKINYTIGKVNDTFSLSAAFVYTDTLEKRNVDVIVTPHSKTYGFKFYPYFVFRFLSNLKEDNYDKNRTQNLNRLDVFQFLEKSNKFLHLYSTMEDLFTLDSEDHLLLDKEKSDKVSTVVFLSYERKFLLRPMILKDTETHREYEGVIMFSNTVDIFATFTVYEFRYLIYLMKKIDLDTLAVTMVTYIEIMRDDTEEEEKKEKIKKVKLELPKFSEPIKEPDNKDEVSTIKWNQENTIPNI